MDDPDSDPAEPSVGFQRTRRRRAMRARHKTRIMSAAFPLPEPSLEPVSSTQTKPPPVADRATRVQERQLGFRLIVGYKFVKAAMMLAVAIWLTAVPGSAYRTLTEVARELAEGGAAFGRLGHWIQHHLSSTFMLRGAILAWLDSLSSALEGTLLLSGNPWAHWIVIVGLGCLLPFEILSLEHRPGIGKVVVLAANVAIVAYLARAELRKASDRH